MQNELKSHEQVSALVDGQIAGVEFARTVEWLQDDEDARKLWDTYHVIGHVLRSGDALVRHHDDAFMARLKHSLKQEDVRELTSSTVVFVAENPQLLKSGANRVAVAESANESFFRWKQVAGVALFAVVSIVGWQVSGGFDGGPDSLRLAQKPVSQPAVTVQPAAIVAADSQVMIRDPQLDAFLAAHKQFGGTSALQMPAGFLRNATFEGVTR